MDSFWAKVARSDGCWEWLGGKDGAGYGFHRLSGRKERAHRVSYLIAHGCLPRSGLIRHLCGNRSCVNPRHLAHGSDKDNHNDSVRHGTACFPNPDKWENHPQAVLSNAEVMAMRDQYESGSRVVDVARSFGRKYTTAWAAIHKQNFTALKKENQNDADDKRRDPGAT